MLQGAGVSALDTRQICGSSAAFPLPVGAPEPGFLGLNKVAGRMDQSVEDTQVLEADQMASVCQPLLQVVLLRSSCTKCSRTQNPLTVYCRTDPAFVLDRVVNGFLDEKQRKQCANKML